jgi:PAS domain S-box-containing protein
MTATIIAPEAAGEFVRTAFERCPSGLIIVNAAGEIVVVNREVERQFGYARESLLGQSVEMLLPDSLAAGHSKLREQYAGIPVARPMGAGRELFGRHKDGRLIPLEIGLSSISSPQGLFILATVVDVTERRQLEERLRQTHKLEALGNLAGGIAHDFNNVLQGIIGLAELVQSAVSKMPSAVADLGVLLDTARRGRDLVNRILLFTRKNAPVRVPTDFEATMREAVQLLRAALPSNIEIREDFDATTPRVLADGNELHQIAMNLATNAAHAMKAKGGVLTIHLGPVTVDHPFITEHPWMPAGPCARLSVWDTGIGIPPDVVDRIFEPFFTTKPTGEGTGLGLSIIERIVRSMRGAVEVQSHVGEGTRFDVYIPAVAAGTPVVKERNADHRERRTILLVDDEVGLARLGQRVLESAGFRVTTSNSSLQALESFRADPNHFDLLITDNAMPRMSGLELVEQVRAIRPDLPILMVSRVGASLSIDTLKERGVDRVLAKPYESADLKSIVKELIETTR